MHKYINLLVHTYTHIYIHTQTHPPIHSSIHPYLHTCTVMHTCQAARTCSLPMVSDVIFIGSWAGDWCGLTLAIGEGEWQGSEGEEQGKELKGSRRADDFCLAYKVVEMESPPCRRENIANGYRETKSHACHALILAHIYRAAELEAPGPD